MGLEQYKIQQHDFQIFHTEIQDAPKPNDFKKSIEWSLKNITEENLEEGILGIISSIDKPLSPFGEAKSDFTSSLTIKIQKKIKFQSKS